MERTFELKKNVGGILAIMKTTGKVVAEYDMKGKPTKIHDWLNMPVQEFVEAYAASM